MSTPIPSTLLRPLDEQLNLRQSPTYKQHVEDLLAMGWTMKVAEELAAMATAAQCTAQTSRAVQ